ncbi:MAG: OmpH family outer membrane protein [Bacteroidetes bacterium]|jgi:outer membrane protein|nr:OmpH family outer membrane protein [Bacteroidota bacterium]
MKKIILFSGLFLFGLSNLTVHAQIKLGHINSSDLVALMPETKKSEDSLKRYTEDLNGQLEQMLAELKTKYTEYQSKQSSWSEAVREYRGKEIQDLQTNIDNFQQRAQQDISSKREELLRPIMERAEQAIKDVAKDGKYTYVFDSGGGTLLHYQDSDDIMEPVKKKLGLPAGAKP